MRRLVWWVVLIVGLVGTGVEAQRMRIRKAPPVPDPPVPSERAVLTTSDFTYLGMFKMPAGLSQQGNFGYSKASISGRYYDGDSLPHLLMIGGSGGASNKQDVVELRIPALNTLATQANYATRLASAPRATVVRTWPQGTLFQNMSTTADSAVAWGIHYVGDMFGNGTQIFGVYDSSYSITGHNPALLSVILNDNGTGTSASGPWGFSLGTGRVNHYMMNVPDDFQTETGVGPIAIGTPRHQNSAAAFSFGTNLLTFTPPALGTPANSPKTGGNPSATDGNGNAWAITDGLKLIDHPSAHKMARNTNVKTCGATVPNQPSPCPGGSFLNDGNGFFGQINAFLDNVTTGVWIDGTNKHGLVFFGEMAETVSLANGFSEDYDYGGSDPTVCHQAYQGSTHCCHGQDLRKAWSATGPGAGTMVGYLWIYDPEDLKPVATGSADPWDPSPTTTAHAADIGGIPEIVTSSDGRVGNNILGQLSLLGSWHDPVGKYLFVTQRAVYQDNFWPFPVVHVYSVNDDPPAPVPEPVAQPSSAFWSPLMVCVALVLLMSRKDAR